jgi:chromosome segregation protein
MRTKEYMQEGIILLGSALNGITAKKPEEENIEELMHDQFRQIERLKVRLEESGALGGGDTIKEYEDTLARDLFLGRELEDLTNAVTETKLLIVDLKAKLDNEFKDGVTSINKAFQEFFATMFGGGSAHLTITMEEKRKRTLEEDEEILEDDDEEKTIERGIEIHVSLPQKKVRELSMLSGGERSLVSIALLFAMSQVNPPPFLVLDETDAALDEANSRRYGDMIERLSKLSQLILVTHNRETMSRASVLYGVTLSADGASKLLSIKFDEAAEYAK